MGRAKEPVTVHFCYIAYVLIASVAILPVISIQKQLSDAVHLQQRHSAYELYLRLYDLIHRQPDRYLQFPGIGRYRKCFAVCEG